jgi:hypothetical protein
MSVEEQECDFFKRGMVSKVVDRIAAVRQSDAQLADRANAGFTRSDPSESA